MPVTSPWKKRLIGFGAVLLTAVVIIPVVAYSIGSYVVGPYGGDGGWVGYLSTIYVAAGRGERAALLLILAPILIVMIWIVSLWLFRRGRTRTVSEVI